MRSCKDCEPGSKRLANMPGPRCITHHRAVVKARKEAAWSRGLLERYGITGEEYWALYAFQGGRCAMCRRAVGKSRRLSVDHDHDTGEVRGLLCSTDNKILGHARDEVGFFVRGAAYLLKPPMRQLKAIGLQDFPSKDVNSQGSVTFEIYTPGTDPDPQDT